MAANSILHSEPVSRSAAPRRRPGSRLYTWMALAAALIVFAGFARTFYLRSSSGAPPLSASLVVHGIVMTAWFVLFFVQVWLVGVGRTDLHRRLGVFGMVLAVLVLCVGVAATIDAGRRGVSPASGIVTPLEFMAVPLFDMPVFAGLVGVAFLLRRRPDVHKRLMVLASLGMLTPAIARIPLRFIQDGGPPVFFGLAIMVVLACVAIDTVRNRKLHRAYAWGALLIVTMIPLRLFIASTEAWTRLAGWLVA
ncbi:MAG: hypothetical protein K0Q43_1550 [Ramlibacter sp.]|jgi:hypothetical protein|nr:hypothetical protein [Ramlibacter sp.]